MLLMWLCEVGRLSLEIGSAHVLDWTKYLATKQLTGFLLHRVCCFLIFSSLFLLLSVVVS